MQLSVLRLHDTPVAITVEGANILTRTLITFAQGALRAHPYLYAEIAAAQDKDQAGTALRPSTRPLPAMSASCCATWPAASCTR